MALSACLKRRFDSRPARTTISKPAWHCSTSGRCVVASSAAAKQRFGLAVRLIRMKVGRWATPIWLAAAAMACAGPIEPSAVSPPEHSPTVREAPAGCYRADEFEWISPGGISLVSSKTRTYSVWTRFTNCSDMPRKPPTCFAIPGKGQAPKVDWDKRPMIDPHESVRVSGQVTFPRKTYDYDELICDRRIAKTYVH